MNNELTVFDDKQLQTIKDMYCKNLTEEEIVIFMHICQRTKLDPFAKQIYAVKRKDTKLGKDVMTVQTGIDGYRLIAERTGKYAPGKEPSFQYNAKGDIVSATSYVMKLTPDGKWHEVAATAHWNEYCQSYNGKPSGFWAKMPHGQISKCAEALALRKAFPADLSGVYTKEEMEQQIETVEAEVVNAAPSKPEKKQKEVSHSPVIGEDKLAQLMAIKESCDPAYMHKLMSYLATLGVLSFDQLKESDFNKVVNGMMKNAELFSKAKANV